MSKIDVSKIEGYASMSAEDKLKALEAYEIDDPDYSGYVEKKTFDTTASELAKTKKELKEKMTADEQTKQAEQEAREKLEKDYKALLRETTISKNKAKYLALGYDEKLADETAIALTDGDTEKIFANQKKFMESVEKKTREKMLDDNPAPAPDGIEEHMTLEKFRKLSPKERMDFHDAHPDDYKTLYGGNE
jgi:hypothetical protein